MLPSEPESPVMVELYGNGCLRGQEGAIVSPHSTAGPDARTTLAEPAEFATRRVILFGRKSGTITVTGGAP
jgi:hypothetical protein